MDLLNFSETLKPCWIVIVLAILSATGGSRWIDYLYPKARQRDSLSFPKQIESRAKLRKPVLTLTLAICFYTAWLQNTSPMLWYVLIAITFLLLITVTDIEQHAILNEMLLLFALIGFCYVFHLNCPLTDHVLAAVGGGLFFLFLAVISRGAIGGGDIKLIAVMGLWFGARQLLSIILYGAIAGGIAALILLLTHRIKRQQYLAYGPYFALCGIGILLSWLRVLF